MKKLLIALTGVLTLAVTAVCVTIQSANAEAVSGGYVYHAGEIADVSDAAKLYEYDGGGVGDNNGKKHRYADNAQYFTYKVEFDAGVEAYAYLTLYASSNRSVKISSDNVSWTEIHYSVCNGATSVRSYTDETVMKSLGSEDNGNQLKFSIALNSYLNDEGGVYLRFGAHDAAYGWGGDLYALSFRSASGVAIEIKEDGKTNADVADETLFNAVNGTGIGESNGAKHRFADQADFFTYKAKFAGQNARGKYLKTFWKGTNRALYVSRDGDNFALLGCNGAEDKAAFLQGDNTRGFYCFYDLSNYLNENGETYVKFAAKDTSSGNGADVFYVDFLDCGEKDSFGQSAANIIDLTKNSFIESVSVTDFGAMNENDGAGLLPYGNRLAMSAKNTDSFVYKLALSENVDASRAYIRVETAGDKNLIEASKDGETYSRLGTAGAKSHGAVVADGNVYYYSLTPFISGNESVYLRFSSSEKKADGGESFLFALTAYVNRIYEDDLTLPAHYNTQVTHIDAGVKESGFLQPELSRFDNPNNMDDAGYRYFDENSFGVYKISYDKQAEALALVMDVRGGYRISVSSDGAQWKDVLIGEALYARAQASLPKDFIWENITSLVDKTGVLYIKVADATTDGGWGGAFTRISLLSITPVSESEEKIPSLIPQGKLNSAIALYDARLAATDYKTKNAYLGRKVTEDGYFSYKFELPATARSFYTAMRHNGELNVRVSTDGTNYSAIPNEYMLNETNGYGSMLTYNLSYLLTQSKTIYVRFDNINVKNEGVLYSLYAGYNTQENRGKEYEIRNVQAFLANDESESKYLFEYDNTQMGVTNKYKEYNRTSYGVYRFALHDGAKAIKLLASIGNSFVLSVSSDNVNYTDILISDQQYYGNNHLSDDTVRDVYIDITNLVGGEYLYVKVADLIDDNDCGAQLRGLGVICMSGDEKTENSSDGQENPDEEKPENEKSGCKASVSVGLLSAMVAAAVYYLAAKKKKN